MNYVNSLTFAREQDKKDPLKKFRKRFLFPKHKGKEVLYFVGNSLGLQPTSVADYLKVELNDWAALASEGHFKGHNPWYSYHEIFAKPMAKLVGALPTEVVTMNQLTTNLHLMLVSFYRPTAKRYKILCEANAFPSDLYALQTQIKLHGYKPEDALVTIAPRKKEHLIRTEDIVKVIKDNAESLAVVVIGGINYLTGQLMDMATITQTAHQAGAYAGFDLAHAAGNVEMQLHNWNVDFAVWCTYKYLNSGPGAVGGAFIHQRHVKNPKLLRLGGWWGYDKNTRFLMKPNFAPMPTAEGWQLSNAPVLSMAAHKAALDIFMEAGGMKPLCKKSLALTQYLAFILSEVTTKIKNKKVFLEIVTPKKDSERGCQLSVIAHGLGKEFYEAITAAGVFCDWRQPNIIRIAPAPLYNSFEDVWKLGTIITKVIASR